MLDLDTNIGLEHLTTAQPYTDVLIAIMKMTSKMYFRKTKLRDEQNDVQK